MESRVAEFEGGNDINADAIDKIDRDLRALKKEFMECTVSDDSASVDTQEWHDDLNDFSKPVGDGASWRERIHALIEGNNAHIETFEHSYDGVWSSAWRRRSPSFVARARRWPRV